MQSPTEPRARRMSLTTGSRHKTVTPSPLSQSTSAIHLSVAEPVAAHIPRRLSKRRKPFIGLFGGQSQDNIAHIKSPSSPTDTPVSEESVQQRNVLRRKSMAGPPVAPSASAASLHPDTAHKEKHSSFMGRIARRFSVMRKPDPAVAKPVDADLTSDSNPNADHKQSVTDTSSSDPIQVRRSVVNGARSPVSSKRIPPPSIDGESTSAHHRASTSLSLETSPVQGKLTITNPDDLNSFVTTSPVQVESELPMASVPETPRIETHAPPAEEHSPVTDAPVMASPVAPEAPLPPQVQSAAEVDVVTTASPLEAPAPVSSPPLPELPPPSISGQYDHSLPPTPATTARPLSMSTEYPTATADATSYSASVSGLTSGYTVYSPSAVSVAGEDPSLARASIMANPGTPHMTPSVIFPSAQGQTQDASKIREGSPTKSGHHAKSSSATKRRETETFKLVRSPSGGMHAAGDVILGMGEQWEVVESESPKKSKKKERSRERGAEEGEARRDHRRQRSVNDRPSTEQTPSSTIRSTRTPSVDTGRRTHGYDGGSSTHRNDRSRSSQRKESEAEAAHNAKAAAAAAANSSSSHHHHRERHNSTSARPTSDFQSGDMNALRAKEAWEMERLWKARSMAYGPDGVPLVSTPPTIGDASRPSTVVSTDAHQPGTIPSTTDLHRAMSLPHDTHGSGHTYYMVQSPVQGFHSASQSAPVIPPPPIIYSSIPQPQQPPPTSSPPRRRQVSRSFSDRVPFPIKDRSSDPPSLTRNYIVNPLPDPPRLSPYQASPLPSSLAVASLVGAGVSTSSQNYAQYAGVPTRY